MISRVGRNLLWGSMLELRNMNEKALLLNPVGRAVPSL